MSSSSGQLKAELEQLVAAVNTTAARLDELDSTLRTLQAHIASLLTGARSRSSDAVRAHVFETRTVVNTTASGLRDKAKMLATYRDAL